MLPAIARGLFNMDGESHESRTTKFSFAGHASSNKSSVAVGLRILIQISQGKSNIVLKSALRLSRPTSRTCLLIPRISSPESYCFLKSCYLCNKELSPNKDVYMYRGDQGFCSAECRSRQIGMDEMKEIETSTKKRLASFQHFRTTGRCETRVPRRGIAAAT